MKPRISGIFFGAVTSLIAFSSSSLGAPLYKTSNSDSLSSLASWSTTSGAQTPNPAALTTTDAWYFNEVSMLGNKTVSLGGDITVGGLALDYVTTDTANNLVISAGNKLTLAGTTLHGNGVHGTGGSYTSAGLVLNRGAGGTVVIDANVAISAAQSWGTSRALTLNGPGELGANNLLLNYAGGTSVLSNVVSGTAKVTKQGAGTLRLSGNNTFSGGFQFGPDAGAANIGVVIAGHANALGTAGAISRGTQLQSSVAGLTLANPLSVAAGGLRVGGSNNFSLTGTTTIDNASRTIANYGTASVTFGAIDLSSGGTAAFDNAAGGGSGSPLLIDGVISGATGKVTVSGGKVSLNGVNTYAGATTVSGGRLTLNGSLAAGSAVALSGGQLAGAGTINGTLAISGGSIVLPGGATTMAATFAQGAIITNTPTVQFDALPQIGTTYDVFSYGSGVLTGLANLKAASRGTLTDDTVNHKVVFAPSAGQTRTWNTTTGTWEGLGANTTWIEGDQRFFNQDSAVFGDIAADSIITVSGTVNAAGFLIQNSANTYTFQTGTITGATGLTKTGAGSVVLSANHTFTGDVLIAGGTVTGTGGVPSANTNSSFGLKSGSRTITVQNAGSTLWLATNAGSSNTFGGGGMTTAQIPQLVAENGGVIRSGKFNTVGNITLRNGGHLTSSTTETSTLYGGYQFIGDIVVSGTGTGSFIDLNGSTRQNHLKGAGTTNFTVADVTGDAGADLTVSTVLGDGSGDYAGVGSLSKSGAGKMVLTAVNTYTGTTTISGGNLETGGAGTLGTAGIYAAAVSNSGVLSIGSTAAQTFSGVISGGGALQKSAAGVLTLSGMNTYTGATTITGGSVVVTGSLAAGSAVAVTGGTLRGTGTVNGAVTVGNIGSLTGGDGTTGTLTVGSLTLDAGGSLNVGTLTNYTSASAITATGTLTVTGGAGSVVVNLPTAPAASGTYHLISSSNTLAGGTQFVIGSAPALGSRQTGTIVANAGQIDYVISGLNPKWTGALSGEWSTGVLAEPKNWFTNITTDYLAGDSVTFDDSATGTTDVTLAANVTPAAVAFDNSTLNYTLTGAGAINGAATSLTKTGTGAVTLNTANTYGGGTVLNGGALILGNPGALGTGPLVLGGGALGGTGIVSGVASGGPLLIDTTGVIQLTGVNAFTGPITLTAGTLSISGAGQLGAGTYAGTIANGGVLAVNSTANHTLSGVISGTGSLTKNNTGTLALSATSNFTGGTVVESGLLNLTGGGGSAGTIRGVATVKTGGTLQLSTGDATGYATDATRLNTIHLEGGVLHVNTVGNQTLGSAVINMTGSSITGIANSNLDFFGGASALNTLAASTTSTISGVTLDIRQGQGAVFTVAQGSVPSGVDLEITSKITNKAPAGGIPGTGTSYGSNPLIKAGEGALKVSSTTNNYIGSTTVNGGVLDLTTGSLYTEAANTTAVVTANANGRIKLNSFASGAGHSLGLLDGAAALRVLNGGTFEVAAASETATSDFTVAAAGGTFRYVPSDISNTLTLAGNASGNITINGPLSLETLGNVAVTDVLEGTGSLVKTGAATLTLSGRASYTGDTTVAAGLFQLVDNARMDFVIGANGVNNRLTGAGTATLNGDFNIITTGANLTAGNSWTLVDVATLNETFGSTFSLVGFTKVGTVHTKVEAGNTWTFSEATGKLKLSNWMADFSAWMDLYPSITEAADRLPEADPDGDGMINLQEYAFGLDPASGSSVSAITSQLNKTTGNFTYTRRKPSLTGMSYTVWTSVDLVNWTQDAGAIQTPTDNGDNQTVAVTLSGSLLTNAKLFIRVRAQ